MSRIIAVLSRTAAAHRSIIAVMSRIYCEYFGARHLIGDDYTAILLLYTTVSDDFPTVPLRLFLIGSGLTFYPFNLDLYDNTGILIISIAKKNSILCNKIRNGNVYS